jgi:glyceraldehyde-3-phosphate dehydrogenase (NADP+)
MSSIQEVEDWGYYVGGELQLEGEPLQVRSCFSEELVATTYRPPEEKIEEAVRSCVAMIPLAARTPTFERARVLRELAQGIEAQREAFVRMLALEAGKPVKAGRIEVERCIFNLFHAAEESQRVTGEVIPLDLIPAGRERWGLVRRFPLGAILAITPFNFPLNLVVHKVAPAIAAGNSVVQKPASKTPICSLMLARILHEVDFLPGILNVLPMSGGQAEQVARDDRFAMLTFTGSSDVGWHLKAQAGRKRVTLELGGNAAVIVHDDTDLGLAAAKCAGGGFGYAGQSCISVQRIFVQKGVFESFLSKLVDAVNNLVVGDPTSDETDVGPLISREDARRIEKWVEEAVEGGARIITGGRRHGSIFEPTVLTDTEPDMKVNCCEIFGPVVTVIPYDSPEEVIAGVNDSAYGLQAGIFTNDNRLIFKAFQEIEVGGVVANDVPTFRADHMPYGGMKGSGIGREGARYAIEEMTERKILVLNLQ